VRQKRQRHCNLDCGSGVEAAAGAGNGARVPDRVALRRPRRVEQDVNRCAGGLPVAGSQLTLRRHISRETSRSSELLARAERLPYVQCRTWSTSVTYPISRRAALWGSWWKFGQISLAPRWCGTVARKEQRKASTKRTRKPTYKELPRIRQARRSVDRCLAYDA
jgi:hypothetical protein